MSPGVHISERKLSTSLCACASMHSASLCARASMHFFFHAGSICCSLHGINISKTCYADSCAASTCPETQGSDLDDCDMLSTCGRKVAPLLQLTTARLVELKRQTSGQRATSMAVYASVTCIIGARL